MALKIKASSLLTARYLLVKKDHVRYCETAIGSRIKKFKFNEIQCVLMSADNVLSLQVGRDVYKLPVKPGNRTHQETIDALVQGIRQSI